VGHGANLPEMRNGSSTNRLFETPVTRIFERMAKFVVGNVAAFPPGSRRRVSLEGREIAIFNVDGRFRALRDVCPHQGAELSAGTVVRSVASSGPGCYEMDLNRVLVKCPWHGWEFDLETGQSWCDPLRQRTRPYPISVEPGASLLPIAEGDKPTPGPFVAETISISVEDDYVVVELESVGAKAVTG
jgi:nitrite reductase/ring-hydroxylating ferredoxin subunit